MGHFDRTAGVAPLGEEGEVAANSGLITGETQGFGAVVNQTIE